MLIIQIISDIIFVNGIVSVCETESGNLETFSPDWFGNTCSY